MKPILALIALFIGGSFAVNEYQDLPGFADKFQQGRTKNSVAAMLTGLVAQKAYGPSTIHVNMIKTCWPDSEIDGKVTNVNNYCLIDTKTSLLLSSAHFTAEGPANKIEGKVEKSEFDWTISQKDQDTYTIVRFGLKRNYELTLHVADGQITGTLYRAWGFNWDISGHYDEHGNLDLNVSAPLTLGFELKGTVRPVLMQ